MRSSCLAKLTMVAAALGLAGLSARPVLAQDDRPAEKSAEELFKELDKNADGKLTADELPEDRKRFFDRLVRVADKNADGALSVEEFREGVRPEERREPAGPFGRPDREGRRPDPRERFKELDKNADGKLTLDEMPERLRERMKQVFERLGKDALDVNEFTRAQGGVGGPPDGQPNPRERFKELDKNADGKLTLDEMPERLRERMKQVFERLGKDALDVDEFARAQGGGGGAPGGRPGAAGFSGDRTFLTRIDRNGDGKVTLDESPEFFKPRLEEALKRAGKSVDEGLTIDELSRLLGGQPGGAAPGAGRGGFAGQGGAGFANFELFLKRYDVDGDGKITIEENPEPVRPTLERLFEQLGKPKEPGIPLEEAVKLMQERSRTGAGFGFGGDFGGMRSFQPVIFTRLDADRDGKISKEEWSKFAELFDELDADKNGTLELRELMGQPLRAGDFPGLAPGSRDGGGPGAQPPAGRGARPGTGDAPREGVRPRDGGPGARQGANGPVQRLDANGDGKISEEEARGQLKANFKKLDANGDGFLVPEELRDALRELRGGQRPRREAPSV